MFDPHSLCTNSKLIEDAKHIGVPPPDADLFAVVSTGLAGDAQGELVANTITSRMYEDKACVPCAFDDKCVFT